MAGGAGGAITRADVERSAVPARVRATPRARHLAAAAGIDLRTVTGSGGGHEIYARDLPTTAPPARRATDLTARRRAAVAALMARSKREIPHYYLGTTVDLHVATEWLTQANAERDVHDRLIPAALVLRATALAAAAAPRLNGFWIDDGFVPADGVHLGVAISLRGGGLLAPCIRDADQLDLDTVMRRLRDLVTGARSGVLPASAMTDPTLTVTNIGEQGVEELYGVIYPPQVALLGVGAIVDRPWAVDGMLTVHPVVRISLAADHRASDGHEGAKFLAAVDRLLQHPDAL